MAGNKEYRSKRIAPADVLRHYVMCQMLNSGMTQQQVADQYGISRQAVLYQLKSYGHFPFHRILDRLQMYREKYGTKDTGLAQTILHAAECIVNLELTLKKKINEAMPVAQGRAPSREEFPDEADLGDSEDDSFVSRSIKKTQESLGLDRKGPPVTDF